MCGISGIYDLQLQNIDIAKLDKMGHTMQHRGPDNYSSYDKGYVGFAHNRLSLLDLSNNGNQPWYNDRYMLVYNGEIYNFQELRQSLVLHNIQYRSSSDTEVLFYYLIYNGIDKTLADIRGMYAFAFFDLETKKLVLARDRIGIKPLFYAEYEQAIYFASELKAIHAAVRLALDEIMAVASSLGVLDKSRVNTVFKGLYHVEPGTYIVFEPGKEKKITKYFKFSSYFNRDYYNQLNSMPEEAVQDEFDKLLDEAVGRMLISDAKMGLYVSGGIDSGLISGIANKYKPGISMFTANVIGKFSEFNDAKLLADAIQAPLYDYRFEPSMFIRDLPKVTWHYETPVLVHQNAVPFSNVSALARQHEVKAVLTGEGSDELFLGYPMLFFKRFEPALGMPLRLLKKMYGLVPKLKGVVFSENVNDMFQSLEMQFQRFERQIIREEEIAPYSFLSEQQRREHYLTIQMLNEHIVTLLWRNDRMGMISSIEARFPFLDEKVIEFAINLPIKYKLRRSRKLHDPKHPFITDKYIVRKSYERHVPPKLYNKRKDGFPMYGLHYLNIQPAYFKNGFWADLMKFGDKEVDYMVSNSSKYILSKLMAVDLWGRIFVRNEPIEMAHEHLAKNVVLRTGDRHS